MHETGDQQVAVQMENIATVVLIMGMQFLLSEMESVLPTHLSCFEQGQG